MEDRWRRVRGAPTVGCVHVLVTALLCVPASGLTACSTEVTAPPPATLRVAGPQGWSYRVPAGSWTAEPDGLRWRDAAGRPLAALSGAASQSSGYASGACGEEFSARAVAGFAHGRHAAVVRRFELAVGGPPVAPPPTRWEVTLPSGPAATLTRTTVTVADPGPCRAGRVDLAVLTPQPVGGRAGREGVSWVVVADRGAGAAPEDQLAVMAASLRSH